MILDVMQCRAARATLKIGVRELAALAGLSTDTLARFERGAALKPSTIARLQNALEAQGIVFLAAGARAVGPGGCLGPPKENEAGPEPR